jgi:hypothetical protein
MIVLGVISGVDLQDRFFVLTVNRKPATVNHSSGRVKNSILQPNKTTRKVELPTNQPTNQRTNSPLFMSEHLQEDG